MNTYLFNGKNIPQKISELTTLPETGFIWVNCSRDEFNTVLQTIQQLTNIYIDEEHILDCFNPNHPSFFDSMQDYDLLIFHNITNPITSNKLDTHPICFLIFKKVLLTVSQDDDAIEKVNKRLLDTGRRQPSQLISLVLILLNEIINNFLTLRFTLSEYLTQWQTKLLDEKLYFDQWKNLLKFKTNLRRLYVICEEQQDALEEWQENMNDELPQALAIRLHDLINHVLRVLHHIAELENELDSMMELHYAVISKRTNEVMRILTVISAIFLPLTLITNIFGMNFERMLGKQYQSAFYFTLVFMAAIAFLLLMLFKRKKWI